MIEIKASELYVNDERILQILEWIVETNKIIAEINERILRGAIILDTDNGEEDTIDAELAVEVDGVVDVPTDFVPSLDQDE